ncbi:DUF6760 family protein [Streptomyces sp. NPDC092307]|uniref:DUF6760 family protein n=1 Tax=Streptomyces sp. NPDC092307 TaxID=3366013 RepID=UPI003805EF28
MRTYPVELLYRETSYLAYHFHWALPEIHDLEHRQRLRYVREIAHFNTAVNGGVHG